MLQSAAEHFWPTAVFHHSLLVQIRNPSQPVQAPSFPLLFSINTNRWLAVGLTRCFIEGRSDQDPVIWSRSVAATFHSSTSRTRSYNLYVGVRVGICTLLWLCNASVYQPCCGSIMPHLPCYDSITPPFPSMIV